MYFFLRKKNGIRDSDEKSAGYGILVKKERECEIKTPFRTLFKALAKSTIADYVKIHWSKHQMGSF